MLRSFAQAPMTLTRATLPPLRAVQAALRKTTEVLVAELAHPTATPPPWSELEWRVARAVAALHGVASLLQRHLRWQGPPGWVGFLEEQAAHTAARQRRIGELLRLVDLHAREERVGFVPLKGAALHLMGLYAEGDRPMADLDLLTDEAGAQRLAGSLQRIGYRQTATTWKHLVFEPLEMQTPAEFGEHADNPVKVDLHTRLLEILPLRAVDVADLVFPPRPHPGINAYPSLAALMLHLLLHAAGAIVLRAVRMVQLHDIAVLSGRMSGADWEEVCGQVATQRGLWWAFPVLSLVARYYATIPRQVLLSAAAGCRWPLKRSAARQLLSDVSYSDIRRSALPGIEWSQSIREMLEYATQRTVLSAQIFARRQVASDAQLIPAERKRVYLARRARPVRWYALRPVRPAPLDAVSIALDLPR